MQFKVKNVITRNVNTIVENNNIVYAKKIMLGILGYVS